MHVLVINSGSSSIKFSVFEVQSGGPVSLFDGEVSGIGTGEAGFKFRDATGRDLSDGKKEIEASTRAEAIGVVVKAVSGPRFPQVNAVGHRVVHPGAKLVGHQRITDEVMRRLEEAVVFAPLHDPSAIGIIREMMARYPDVPHYACFDTVFHDGMPEEAKAYALPARYREEGVRRYGFHGLSYESVVWQMRKAGMEVPRRMVIAHLGSGCSLTALVEGRSVDTTMGLTPTGGVVMGTRPGDLDPGLVLFLLREGNDVAQVEKLLNRESGMVGLSGLPNDMKAVRRAADGGDERSRLALEIFVRSVRKALGGYCWLLGGLEAVVFTGGIGENDGRTREGVLCGLQEMGLIVNFEANSDKGEGIWQVSASESKTKVYVVPAQEDLMIAAHVERMTAVAG